MIHVFYVIYTKDYCMSHPYDCACIPCFHSWEELEASSLSRQLQQLQAQVEDSADTGKSVQR